MGCWYAPGSTLMVNKNIFERIGPFNECLNRLEDYEWFIRFGLSQGDIVTVKTPLVGITRGHAQNDLISRKNAEQILINWRDRLTPAEFRLMKAYLKLEIAAEAYKNGRHLSSFLSLGQSLSLAPRLTLHLRNWWTRL